MAEAPTMDTKELPVLGEAIRVVPVPAKNPKPVFRTRKNNEFFVYPSHYQDGQTNLPSWLEYSTGLHVIFLLMCATLVLAPVAVAWSMWKAGRMEKEVLRQIGWKETGPCTVLVGVYEWKNGKVTRLGLNHPGDGR